MNVSSKHLYFSLLANAIAFLFLAVIVIWDPANSRLIILGSLLLFLLSFVILVFQAIAFFKFFRSQQVEIQKYKYLEDEIKFYRQHRHDLKNHLIIMYELARLGKTGELESYASEFMEKTDQALLTIQTGNQELDVLLYSKLDQSRKNLIEVNIHNPATLNIHSKRIFNVISILSNLFDNAIEACIEMDNPDDRSISLTIEKDLFNYTFIVTNTFNPTTEVLQALTKSAPLFGMTRKKDKKAHGMGLTIVQALVQRLEGHVEIDIYNQQFFQVKVSLPLVNVIQ